MDSGVKVTKPILQARYPVAAVRGVPPLDHVDFVFTAQFVSGVSDETWLLVLSEATCSFPSFGDGLGAETCASEPRFRNTCRHRARLSFQPRAHLHFGRLASDRLAPQAVRIVVVAAGFHTRCWIIGADLLAYPRES